MTASKPATTQSRHHRVLSGDGSDLTARMAYADHEREAIHKEKVRLADRAKNGKDWDGKAANDNIAWPLATALVREGNTELLKAAMYYRKIHDMAKSEALLGGRTASIGDGIALDRYTYVSPSGHVTYKHPRQKQSANIDIPARQYTVPPSYDNLVPSSEEVKVSNWSNIPKPYNGDAPVNNMMDAQSELTVLRRRLGVLVEPLEMAVVDGETYQAVGNATGTADRSGAIAAGRAVVHMALLSIRDRLGSLKREDLAA